METRDHGIAAGLIGRKGVALVLLLLLVAVGCGERNPASVGKTAPDFQLTGLDGKTYRLSSFKGKLVHLHFWAEWCPRCHEEFDVLGKVYPELKKKYPDFEILGVNVDQPKVHVEDFVRKHPVGFPILLDKGAKVARTYHVRGLPTNFLIGKDGKIREVILGWIDADYLRRSLKRYLRPGA